MRAWKLIASGLLLAGASAAARDLSSDEQVMFVPDTARLRDDGSVEARIEAWVYEFEQRPGLNAVFAHKLDLDLDSMPAPDRDRFEARTQLFRVDSESFKDIDIVVDDPCGVKAASACQRVSLPRTNFAGRSSLQFALPADADAGEHRWLRFSVVMPRGDRRHFKGRTLIVPPIGLSVVSDIDDTIKVSQVRDRRQLMLNTFAREFVAVPGMAGLYHGLSSLRGTRFHYVSSGPIQLYPPLARFMREAGFPRGSVHLRESTAISNVIPEEGESRAHKLATIGRLLGEFPQRRFLLIGDSGEADPEIYGEIARGHPGQVVGIRIRDVSGDAADSPRYALAFAQLPGTLWQIFADAEAIAPIP